MTTYLIDAQLGSDANDGSLVAPWQNLSKIAATAGDGHLFILAGDFRGQAAGTNGLVEFNGQNCTVRGAVVDGVKPIVGFAQGTPVAIASVTISGGTCTVVTSAAHGLAANATFTVAGVAGTATTANGQKGLSQWTLVNATTFTFPLGGSGSDTGNGTVTFEASEKAGFYSNGKNATIEDVRVTRVRYGARLVGAGVTAWTERRLDFDRMGQYAGSCGGSCTGLVREYCTWTLCREDGANFSGSTPFNTGYLLYRCAWSYVGFDFDGVTWSGLAGSGDGVTNHSGNYGDVVECTGTFVTTGHVVHVNTTGTSRVVRCRFSEAAENACMQNSGGTLRVIGTRVWAPRTIALSSSSPRGAFAVKTGSRLEVFGSTVYTDKGVQATPSGSMYCVTVRDAASTAVVKGNRFLSNGSAPFVYVSGGPTLDFDRNGYSHSGTLWTSSGSKTFATWQALGLDANSVTGVAVKVAAPDLDDDGALALNAAAGGLDAVLDLSGVGDPDVFLDGRGRSRGANPDLGAFELVPPSGGRLSGAGRLSPAL